MTNSMPEQLTTIDPDEKPPVAFDHYGFHKDRFRNPKVHAQLRKESAIWLLAMGVQFDNDKFIDPDNLP